MDLQIAFVLCLSACNKQTSKQTREHTNMSTTHHNTSHHSSCSAAPESFTTSPLHSWPGTKGLQCHLICTADQKRAKKERAEKEREIKRETKKESKKNGLFSMKCLSFK